MTKSISYIGFLGLLVSVFIGAEYINQKIKPVVLTYEILEPSVHLLNSKLYFEEKAYDQSLNELKEGIRKIRSISDEIHSESAEKVNYALNPLEAVYKKASKQYVSRKEIDQKTVNTLLALTYVQVTAAKKYAKSADLHKCRKSLKFAKYHVKNALTLSEGSKKDYEVEIFSDMNKVIKNHTLSNTEVKSILNDILDQLKQSKVVFS